MLVYQRVSGDRITRMKKAIFKAMNGRGPIQLDPTRGQRSNDLPHSANQPLTPPGR